MRKFIIGVITVLLVVSYTANAQWDELDSGYESPWIFFDNSFPAGQNNIGFACAMYGTYNGDGIILKTEDGGDNWTTIYPESGDVPGVEAIFFTSLDIGYAAGWDEDALYTDDGGDTWTAMEVGTNVWYYTDIEFWDADNGVMSAQLDAGGSQVWVTDDAGETWTVATGVSIGIVDLTYATADNLFAVGTEEDIIESTDGGATWSLNHDGSDPDNDPLLGVDFYDANFGVVGGMDGKIKITTNGGGSWTTTQIASSYPSFYAIKCLDADNVYVGGTDNIIYKTTDGGGNWSSDNSGGSGTLYQFAFTANGTGIASGASGSILRKDAPLNAEFESDAQTICAGSDVMYTDLSAAATSWSWTFEGGTPSSSTEQNPTITYNTSGVYDVSLTVSDGIGNQTETKIDYITVLDSPAQADMPEGDELACTGGFYEYTTNEVEHAQAYEWILDPVDAGDLTWVDNIATLETDDSWTGDFTLKVRATNMCDDGEWSEEFESSLSLSPDDFNLQGGGVYCNGGDGLEITLDGSQESVDYELYYEGEATGVIVEGTGDEISFGLQTDEGTYTALGFNESCSQNMNEQVEIALAFPPMEPVMPVGPVTICDETTSDYETEEVDDTDTYVWALTPAEAGTITPNGLEATVEWDAGFSGMAYVSVYGENDCGAGNSSPELEVSVGATPEPVVAGPEMVCDNTEESYSADGQTGSTFTWEVSGGTITDGQGTSEVSIAWAEPGLGMVTVMEETELGCSAVSTEFEVTIDDCTAIGETGFDNAISLYPNPASKTLTVSFEAEGVSSTKVYVLNMMGQIVLEQENQAKAGLQSYNLNVSNLKNGIYFVRIQNGDEVITTTKFIKR